MGGQVAFAAIRFDLGDHPGLMAFSHQVLAEQVPGMAEGGTASP